MGDFEPGFPAGAGQPFHDKIYQCLTHTFSFYGQVLILSVLADDGQHAAPEVFPFLTHLWEKMYQCLTQASHVDSQQAGLALHA
jgi:hypothetical protein